MIRSQDMKQQQKTELEASSTAEDAIHASGVENYSPSYPAANSVRYNNDLLCPLLQQQNGCYGNNQSISVWF